MEVDRVTRMGGVGRDEVPAWPGTKRRRKFVEEGEKEPGEETEMKDEESSAGPGEENEHSGGVDVMA